jgi:hypothetical protein
MDYPTLGAQSGVLPVSKNPPPAIKHSLARATRSSAAISPSIKIARIAGNNRNADRACCNSNFRHPSFAFSSATSQQNDLETDALGAKLRL